MSQYIYQHIDNMWTDAIKECKGISASRAGRTDETIGYSACLEMPRYNVLQNARRAISLPYAIAELIWYMAREDHVDRLLAYAPSYNQFADDEGVAHGAYGSRIADNCQEPTTRGANDQLETVLDVLREDPHSRRAVVTFFDATRDGWLLHERSNEPDIPCTVSWQFLIRNNALDMVCTMRSNDVWLGMPYDVFVNTTIQAFLAHKLDVQLGRYYHQVGSLHLYDRNAKAAYEAIEDKYRQPIPTRPIDPPTMMRFDMLADLEALMRDGRIISYGALSNDREFQMLDRYNRWLVLAIAARWFDVPVEVHHPLFVERIEAYVDNRRRRSRRQNDIAANAAEDADA